MVELNDGNDRSHRIDGIPIGVGGTVCEVTEQGAVGEFGETTRSGSPTTLAVTEPTEPHTDEQPVPSAQIATLANDYQFTGLSLTKLVDTDAVDTEFGPFGFTLSCVSRLGAQVTFDDQGATEVSVELAADGTYTAPADRIPAGAACTVTETDDYFADDIVYVGDNVADNGDGSAVVTPGIEPAAVEVTNAYDAGTVTVQKVVDGDGAARYGTGEFTFEVTCTYQEQTPYQDSFTLRARDSKTLGPYPVGTACDVAETGTGGATSTSVDAEDGRVVVPAPEEQGAVSAVDVTATNTFDLTSLDVAKEVRGDTDVDGADGPFTVELSCTWDVEGERVAANVPGGAERTLAQRNDYRATYGELPSSAECELSETETGGADATTITTDVAGVRNDVDGTSAAVDLSTTTGPGQANATLVNTFEAEEVVGAGLPTTGSEVATWQVLLGPLLLMAGAGAIVWSRRRVRPEGL